MTDTKRKKKNKTLSFALLHKNVFIQQMLNEIIQKQKSKIKDVLIQNKQ